MFNKYELKEDSLDRREKAEKVMSLLKYMHKSEINLFEQEYDGGCDNEDFSYPFLEEDEPITDKRKRVSKFTLFTFIVRFIYLSTFWVCYRK